MDCDDNDSIITAILLWPTRGWASIVSLLLFIGYLFYKGHLHL